MKIMSYQYQDVEQPGWKFPRISFSRVNLLVGGSGSGKTRLLNTIFNLGRFVTQAESKHGHWTLELEQNDVKYNWDLEVAPSPNKESIVVKEIIQKNGDVIVDRNSESFVFDGRKMPKLSRHESSVSLLKEEDLMQPLHQGFKLMMRRTSLDDDLKQANYQVIPPQLISDAQSNKDISILFKPIGLSVKLYIIKAYFPKTYSIINEHYKSVFPFIHQIDVKEIKDFEENYSVLGEVGKIPVFCIKEKNVKNWIPIHELSSGMKKVLQILTDVSTLPTGAIYLLDEYENSLGINAIDFFPSFLSETAETNQFFITSHHPYLINNIPPKNWYVFHRTGSEVKIKHGQEYVERFGKSRQQLFVQLINDPFYTEGIE